MFFQALVLDEEKYERKQDHPQLKLMGLWLFSHSTLHNSNPFCKPRYLVEIGQEIQNQV